MWRIKNKIRNIVKRCYHKLNPQYKYILHINDVVSDLHNRISALEAKREPNVHSDSSALDKLFLASDEKVYRYLYLLRYMKENSNVLDVEGEYGVGCDLLYKYTPVDSCVCLNSIDYYTKLGRMYYGSEFVKFQTGTIHDMEKKFDIIILLNEKRTLHFDENDYIHLYKLLEFNGILALALDGTLPKKDILTVLEKIGFQQEERLYQGPSNPELLPCPSDNSTTILYMRKHG